MANNFVRFTVGDGARPIVINISRVDAYGPWQGKTFLQMGAEEYHVNEAFDVVDAIIAAAVQP